MRKSLFALMVIFIVCLFAGSCGKAKQETVENVDTLTVSVNDTAVYGRIGEGAMMHTLVIVTDEGEELSMLVDGDEGAEVLGGMMTGDRVTATYVKGEDDNIAHKVVNLTTLLGRWTSLDRNFTINEDGSVESSVMAESRPYTQWSMVNAKLVFNTDTFDILSLGADSLMLENESGIFVYKRQ